MPNTLLMSFASKKNPTPNVTRSGLLPKSVSMSEMRNAFRPTESSGRNASNLVRYLGLHEIAAIAFSYIDIGPIEGRTCLQQSHAQKVPHEEVLLDFGCLVADSYISLRVPDRGQVCLS